MRGHYSTLHITHKLNGFCSRNLFKIGWSVVAISHQSGGGFGYQIIQDQGQTSSDGCACGNLDH